MIITLLATNGIYFTNQSRTYGVIPPGGSNTQAFTFTVAGTAGESITAQLQAVDGFLNLGLMTQSIALGSQIFHNQNPVSIPDPNPGTASIYPWDIVVAGVTNPN